MRDLHPTGPVVWPYSQPGPVSNPPTSTYSATITFYASSTSGGTVDVLNTVTISYGLITNWTQSAPSGVPGEWQFNDTVNSGQILTIGL